MKLSEISAQAATSFKTERYRYDSAYKTLYKYSKEHNAYLFHSKCSVQEYNVLVKRDGKYVD